MVFKSYLSPGQTRHRISPLPILSSPVTSEGQLHQSMTEIQIGQEHVSENQERGMPFGLGDGACFNRNFTGISRFAYHV